MLHDCHTDNLSHKLAEMLVYLQYVETFFWWTRLSLVRSGFFAFPNLNPCKSRDFASAANNFLHVFQLLSHLKVIDIMYSFSKCKLETTLNAWHRAMFLWYPTCAVQPTLPHQPFSSGTPRVTRILPPPGFHGFLTGFSLSRRRLQIWCVGIGNSKHLKVTEVFHEVQMIIILHQVFKSLLLCHGNWLL